MVLVGGRQDSQLEFGFVGGHSETRKPPDGVSFRFELNGESVNGKMNGNRIAVKGSGEVLKQVELNGESVNGKVNGHHAGVNGRNGIAVKSTRERQAQTQFGDGF